MAMVFTDSTAAGNPIIFVNDSFLSLTGYAREEVIGQEFNFMLAHAADAETLAQVKAEFEGTSDIISEIRYRRRDRTEIWVALFISPVRDETGHVVQYFASLVDLTKHKEEETQARKLIEELNNYRVKILFPWCNRLSGRPFVFKLILGRSGIDRVPAACSLPVPRPVDQGKLEKCGPAGRNQRCARAV